FVWSLVRANQDYSRIQDIHHSITHTMYDVAPSYDLFTYNPIKVLKLLIPARKIVELRDHLGANLRITLWTATIELTALGFLYFPILYFTLREIRKRSKELRLTIATSTTKQAIQFINIQNHLNEEMNALICHAFSTYFSTLMYIPILAWMVCI
ncbi:hypothetical protein CROQUDRAFT_42930, partial [Cronartium quercuum f. sp. fusiforme G11]